MRIFNISKYKSKLILPLDIVTKDNKISGIIEEMMNSIIATDIYNESGVGCDNMTCEVIQFKH